MQTCRTVLTRFPALCARLAKGFDLVSGWKKNRQDPLSKRLLSKLFNWVTARVSGIPIHDFNSGLKAYRREVAQSISLYGEMHRYIPLIVRQNGFSRITEKPVVHYPRKYGKSKYKSDRLIKGFFRSFVGFFCESFSSEAHAFFWHHRDCIFCHRLLPHVVSYCGEALSFGASFTGTGGGRPAFVLPFFGCCRRRLSAFSYGFCVRDHFLVFFSKG